MLALGGAIAHQPAGASNKRVALQHRFRRGGDVRQSGARWREERGQNLPHRLQWSRALSKPEDFSPLECDRAFKISLLLLPFTDALCTRAFDFESERNFRRREAGKASSRSAGVGEGGGRRE
jgi:hypothetical protein